MLCISCVVMECTCIYIYQGSRARLRMWCFCSMAPQLFRCGFNLPYMQVTNHIVRLSNLAGSIIIIHNHKEARSQRGAVNVIRAAPWLSPSPFLSPPLSLSLLLSLNLSLSLFLLDTQPKKTKQNKIPCITALSYHYSRRLVVCHSVRACICGINFAFFLLQKWIDHYLSPQYLQPSTSQSL